MKSLLLHCHYVVLLVQLSLFHRFFKTSGQAKRVQKLTKFFGEEPPLLRIFLKHLGYEKFATTLEDAKIGMLELPYVSEDRLEMMGIPMGPRLRILAECKTAAAISTAAAASVGPAAAAVGQQQSVAGATVNESSNYNVYIL